MEALEGLKVDNIQLQVVPPSRGMKGDNIKSVIVLAGVKGDNIGLAVSGSSAETYTPESREASPSSSLCSKAGYVDDRLHGPFIVQSSPWVSV